MDSFKLIIDPSTFEVESHTVSGEIYVMLNTEAFPDAHWFDICSSIMIMWGENFLKMRENQNDFELFFMDGLYSLLVSYRNGTATITRRKDEKNDDTMYICKVIEIIQEWIDAGNKLLQFMKKCENCHIKKDVLRLEKLIMEVDGIKYSVMKMR